MTERRNNTIDAFFFFCSFLVIVNHHHRRHLQQPLDNFVMIFFESPVAPPASSCSSPGKAPLIPPSKSSIISYIEKEAIDASPSSSPNDRLHHQIVHDFHLQLVVVLAQESMLLEYLH